MDSSFKAIWIMFCYVFFCNIIKVKLKFYIIKVKVLYCFIILLRLISSFLHTRSLFIPHLYVFIESILPSFELKAILLISSVKVLYFSLLNIYCVFNVNLLFFYEFFMIFFKTIHDNYFFKWIILVSI